MAKEIASGINEIVENINQRALDQSQSQWRSIKNRIDSLLISSNAIKSDDARKKCQNLDDMSNEDRVSFITTHWGCASLERINPLLQQLDILEKSINS